MCAGACLNARLERVVYGAPDEAAGCLGSQLDLFRLGLPGAEPPKVIGGVLEEECREALRSFFAKRRPNRG